MLGLSDDELRSFAARGFLTAPKIASPDLIAAAMARVDRLIAEAPPPADRRGFHFYWIDDLADDDPLFKLLRKSVAWDIAASLVAPLALRRPRQAQVSLNIPISHHRPGGPHIDGLTPPEPSGRPGTFTLLAGLFLTDQMSPDMGNLWVWPGSHHQAAAYLRDHGPEAILDIAHPTFPMSPPEQVLGRAGDVLLSHYLLGHNMGGNSSPHVRRVVYFRLQTEGHASRWRECVQYPWTEFEPVRLAVERRPVSAPDD
jgi:hypothetical protein